MSNLLNITEATSLALHTMALLANHQDQRWSNVEIAAVLGASEHTLAKVLQKLSHDGLLVSTRGPHGGFTLGKPTEQVSLLDIYEAIEGPLLPADCLLNERICDGRDCVLGGLVQAVQEQVRAYLASTSLADLAQRMVLPAKPLQAKACE